MKNLILSLSLVTLFLSFKSIDKNPIKNTRLKADADNEGINLPKGFGALVVSEGGRFTYARILEIKRAQLAHKR